MTAPLRRLLAEAELLVPEELEQLPMLGLVLALAMLTLAFVAVALP